MEELSYQQKQDKITYRRIKIGVSIVVVLLLILLFNPTYFVGAEYKGLVFKWGALQETVLEPGFHWRYPIYENMKEITIQPIRLDYKAEVGEDGAISQDNQTIGADVTVFYKYKPYDLPIMYREYGETKIKSILMANIRESFKATIGNYKIFELPVSQDKIRAQVLEVLSNKLAVYPIELTEVKVVNYNWSEDFDKQIKETMNRAQQVKQKEQELLIAQNEQQKKVKEAEAEKQALITKAEGEKEAARLHAEAKVLEGEGIRKYNQSVALNWEIELKKMELEIEKIRVQQWNGQYVPNNVYSPIPLSQGGIQGK